MAKAFPGISTSEVRKKLRYMLPPSKTDPKDTPKYTWAFTNLSEKEKNCKYFFTWGITTASQQWASDGVFFFEVFLF